MPGATAPAARASPAGEHRPVPCLVGRLPAGGAPTGGPLGPGGRGGLEKPGGPGTAGAVALQLATTDRALLDLVGRHSFRRSEQLAVLLGCPWGLLGCPVGPAQVPLTSFV